MQKHASATWLCLFIDVVAVALLVFSLSWPEQGATKVREYEGAKYYSSGRVGPEKGTPSVCIRSLQLSRTLPMGLTSIEKKISYFAQVCSPKALHNAWRKVYASGKQSKSSETKQEIAAFNENADNKIDQIYRQLLKRKFRFKPSRGIPISKGKKKYRPIVKSQIPDRIVQRSILDVLQGTQQIYEYISPETSFGGIEKRSVKDAIKMAYEAMQNGAKWHICSDIQDFFTKIPKDNVLQVISQFITDDEFNTLLKAAVKVELENLASLGERRDLFPIYEIGVAQGCCLSPLIGNILLHDFDIDLNGRGITCLRYIDDFIILGPTQMSVKAAFKSASKKLNGMGFSVYDPFVDNRKAHFGPTDQGIEFLGCEIIPGLIRPSKKARAVMLDKVEKILKENSQLLSDPSKVFAKGKSLIETLSYVSNVIMGWGNQYSFCNDFALMKELDRQIDVLIANYLQKYKKAGPCPFLLLK